MAGTSKSSSGKSNNPVVISDSDSDDYVPQTKAAAKKVSPTKAAPKPSKASSSKRKIEDDFYDSEEEDVKPVKKAAKKAAAPKKETEDSAAEKARKQQFAEMMKRKAAGPVAPGSKEIPIGTPNCLAGLIIVFTGELESIGRQDATALAKRYGAKVTSAPSSKTSHVVIGTNAGPSKIAKLAGLKAEQIDEDEFLDLIRTRSSKDLDPATKKKLADEEKKIRQAAKDMENEASKPKASGSKSGAASTPFSQGGAGVPKSSLNDPSALWTTKYAPRRVEDLIGNKSKVELLRNWLRAWPKSVECGFKKPGKDAMGTFRAVLISGAPGIGKTTAAHLAAQLEGFTPVEFNASDTRSKRLIQDVLNNTINNTNIDAWLGKDTAKSDEHIRVNKRTVLIMDEVDGMSGGDRGGVGAVNALIKKTKVPIICIANDRKNQKMKPFEHTCFHMPFIKPDISHAKSRMLTIAYKEKLKIKPEVIEQIIQGAQNDIRLVLNMLSTWKLSSDSMSFDEGRELGAANAKPGMHTPFTLYQQLTAAGTWQSTSKMTLNDKADLYFQDHSILPLMVHENYMKNTPALATSHDPKIKEFESLRLLSKAAKSISDGDMIDSMIHGPQQQWSLMPHHAIASVVRPISFARGFGNFPSFPSWLGKNSAQGRLTRAAVELQAKMRLATSGSRFEIRETYAPYLFPLLSQPMLDNGSDGIASVISVMDDYYLSTEDRETILELGVGKDRDWEQLSKKIPSATKGAFTRKYNASNHPIAFYKGIETISKISTKANGDEPDLEEAYQDDVAEVSDVEMKSDDDDLSKNKLVKQKKAKAVKGAAVKSPTKAKAKAKPKPKSSFFDKQG